MAVVANQAVAFDKSMLMACPHLGDVLRSSYTDQAGSVRVSLTKSSARQARAQR